MTLTIAPADEACQALVTLINSPTTGYALDFNAQYSRVEINPLEEIQGLLVDVVADEEETPGDRLDAQDQSSHDISVWIRSQLPGGTPQSPEVNQAIGQLCLLRQQIFLQLNNWQSANGRVSVWDAGIEKQDQPLKAALKQANLFAARIALRVEVPR